MALVCSAVGTRNSNRFRAGLNSPDRASDRSASRSWQTRPPINKALYAVRFPHFRHAPSRPPRALSCLLDAFFSLGGYFLAIASVSFGET
jgi:hypothetical protein